MLDKCVGIDYLGSDLNISWECFSYEIVLQYFSKIKFQFIPDENFLREYYIQEIKKKWLRLYPQSPEIAFRDKWISWYDFFGIFVPLKKWKWYSGNRYYSLHYLQFWIKNQNICTLKDYREKRENGGHEYIHTKPWIFYFWRWWTWDDVIGEKMYNWDEFLFIINKRWIKKQEVYKKECESDPRLPKNPWKVYSDKWTNWGDVFRTKIANSLIVKTDYAKVVALILENDIRTNASWYIFVRQNPTLNLPSQPNRTYRLGKYGSVVWDWVSLREFIDRIHTASPWQS